MKYKRHTTSAFLTIMMLSIGTHSTVLPLSTPGVIRNFFEFHSFRAPYLSNKLHTYFLDAQYKKLIKNHTLRLVAQGVIRVVIAISDQKLNKYVFQESKKKLEADEADKEDCEEVQDSIDRMQLAISERETVKGLFKFSLIDEMLCFSSDFVDTAILQKKLKFLKKDTWSHLFAKVFLNLGIGCGFAYCINFRPLV